MELVVCCADPSYALGRIAGIEPSRDRTEDYKARNAMDAAENKGPAVQDRPIFAPDVKGASKACPHQPGWMRVIWFTLHGR